MTPENGGRIELKLGPASGTLAEYLAQLSTPAGSWSARAHVADPGSAGSPPVRFDDWAGDGPGPPEWLIEVARAALKAALRSSQSEGRWPRRITRWRPEPGA